MVFGVEREEKTQRLEGLPEVVACGAQMGVGEGGIPVNCPVSKGGEEGTPVATRPARLEGTGGIWLDGWPGLSSNRLGV